MFEFNGRTGSSAVALQACRAFYKGLILTRPRTYLRITRAETAIPLSGRTLQLG